MSRIEQQIAKLPAMKGTALRALWQKTFNSMAPAGAQREFIARLLAYALQEKQEGPLPRSVAKRLAAYPIASRANVGAASPSQQPQPSTTKLRLGARLVRSWKGKTHEVTVIDRGFAYRGKQYRSLTEVAELITGVHWSGPRFFGLRSPKTKSDAAASQEAS